MIRLPLCLLAATLALAACRPAPAESAAAPAAPAAPVLEGRQLRFPPGHPQLAQLPTVAAAPARSVPVELPARLVWNEDRTQRLFPAFAGRVVRIGADVGQPVRRGAVLAELASPDFGIAQADTAKAQVDARLAQKTLARQRELFEAGVIARKDLEQAEAEAARSQADLQRAEARTRLYGGGAAAAVDQRLSLVAGIAGVVVERNLTPGQELRPEQSGPGVPPLFVLSDPTSLWVQIDARETEAGVLQPGAAFELVVPSLPGEKFQGQVLAAADAIDPNTRTIKIRGLVANPGRKLKAEMLATARIDRPAGAGVVVPAQAVTLRGSQHAVMVQVQPGVFEPREVVLGWQGPTEVVVRQGLAPGEQVVSDNLLLLTRQYRTSQEDVRSAATAGAGRAESTAAADRAATAR
ncbi:MAG TPA: efflux RND transporter periplasmic adaptor subunit [Ramlibacter sp.]|uniref:efflux RND transporter periplasmic adaptor subunit n=1 Tax=Ramlibacter sp. TaxID=1917967 RepID=UPI002D416BCE|nr:efflux RND transporter periplasmic adaptor subunit [Ramlibacter sp.]HZY17285.1 efflux RND transporter periplasmic adaptor subunit [Ramlibacter sp.]